MEYTEANIKRKRIVIRFWMCICVALIIVGIVFVSLSGGSDMEYVEVKSFYTEQQEGSYCEAEIELIVPLVEEYTSLEINGGASKIKEKYYCIVCFGKEIGIVRLSKRDYENKFSDIVKWMEEPIDQPPVSVKVYGDVCKLSYWIQEKMRALLLDKGYAYTDTEFQQRFGNMYLDAEMEQRRRGDIFLSIAPFLFAIGIVGIMILAKLSMECEKAAEEAE